jgi:hypothetical protein
MITLQINLTPLIDPPWKPRVDSNLLTRRTETELIGLLSLWPLSPPTIVAIAVQLLVQVPGKIQPGRPTNIPNPMNNFIPIGAIMIIQHSLWNAYPTTIFQPLPPSFPYILQLLSGKKSTRLKQDI